MWFLLLLFHTFGPVSSEPNQGKILLRGNRDNPCEGYVEAYYGSEIGYAGDKYWSTETEKVVCKTTHCGEPEPGASSKDVYRPLKSKIWFNELNCTGNEKSLWDCDWPGPGVSFYNKPTVKKVTCSDMIELKLNQHQCEGAVQYKVKSQKEKIGYICRDGFGDKEAEMLCKSLKCGNFRETLKSEWMLPEDFHHEEIIIKEINCKGIKNTSHLWQCVNLPVQPCTMPAVISCEGHDRVQLTGDPSNVCSGYLEKEQAGTWNSFNGNNKKPDKLCKQMHCGSSGNLTVKANVSHLTCSDQVKVILTDGGDTETKCYGQVKIKVNNTNRDVCGTDWGKEEAEMVCKELNCGKPISHKGVPRSTKGILDHVECKNESSLWHCRAKRHSDTPCSSLAYVVCSESFAVELKDGPGKCAGRLEVQHEGQWKVAHSEIWNNKYSDIICRKLNCGKSLKISQTFAKGNNNFLTLSCKSVATISDISECITENQNTEGEKKHIDITCNEHKVTFLDGTKPCSGAVMIEHSDRTEWHSGSNETWILSSANEICQSLHCGNASHFSSQNCSSIKTVNKCNQTEPIAYVECEGSITVTLSEGCYGKVKILTASMEGFVSRDAWTDEMSKKLCKELSCGNTTLPSYRDLTETQTHFKSLHALRGDWRLSQYSLVANKMTMGKPAYVVCKGRIKPRFKPSRDKCSGNIQVFYEGAWLPVHNNTDTTTMNTICEELHCGSALQTIPYFGPPEENTFIKLKCNNNEKSLATCQKIETEKFQNTEPLGLKCSKWRTVALEVEHSCKGHVVVYSADGNNEKRHFISSEGWTEAEGRTLCENMNCQYKSMNNATLEPEDSLWPQTFNCSSESRSIWDCEKNETAIPSKKDKLMVECHGEPVVKLSGKCTGTLTINDTQVCSTRWDINYSHRVCQELNCGNAIYYSEKEKPKKFYHVHCDEHNYLIGQCKREYSAKEGQCNSSVFISCAGSVSFTTSEKCGGLLTVKNGEDKKKVVCHSNITRDLSNKLCVEWSCGSIKEVTMGQQTYPKTQLICPRYFKHPKYCVQNEGCKEQGSTQLLCTGHLPTPKATPPPKPTDPVPIIVVVLILLILIVLLVIFVRYHIKRRNRKAVMSSDTEEPDWDSGEYEDVEKSDEMGSFNRGRFRSESDIQGARDLESKRSYNYDDIDEVTEAQPLTPQGSAVRAAKEEDMQEGVVKPSDESVTYEVEDEQENYDDIEASPETAETTAEVHEGPKLTPAGDAGESKGQAHKDED